MVRTGVNGGKCVYFVQDKTVWLDENLFLYYMNKTLFRFLTMNEREKM